MTPRARRPLRFCASACCDLRPVSCPAEYRPPTTHLLPLPSKSSTPFVHRHLIPVVVLLLPLPSNCFRIRRPRAFPAARALLLSSVRRSSFDLPARVAPLCIYTDIFFIYVMFTHVPVPVTGPDADANRCPEALRFAFFASSVPGLCLLLGSLSLPLSLSPSLPLFLSLLQHALHALVPPLPIHPHSPLPFLLSLDAPLSLSGVCSRACLDSPEGLAHLIPPLPPHIVLLYHHNLYSHMSRSRTHGRTVGRICSAAFLFCCTLPPASRLLPAD